jgi:hypothetical protein
MSQRVREMIDRGHTNKTIIERLNVKPQVVYNMRYQINKARGLGSIGKPAPKPAEGIGTPPKRNVRPKELASIIKAERDREFKQALVEETLRHHPEFLDKPPFAITMIEKPTLWERFRNFVRALGGRS